MSFLSSLLPIAGGVVGNLIAPGIGGAIGGALGSAASGGLNSSGQKNASGAGIVQNAFGTAGQTYSRNPGWVDTASQDIYNKASTAAGVPYQSYTGNRVAPLSSNQQIAANNAAGSVGRFAPAYSQISSYYNQLSNPNSVGYNPVSTGSNPQSISTQDFTQANLNGYMNPYIEQALQPQINDINQDYATRQNQLNQQAGGSGNFGGSRQALLNNLLTKQQQEQINNVRGQGYNTAFNNATQLFTSDQNRNLQGQTAQASINEQNLARQLQAQLANQNAGINTGEFNVNTQQQGIQNAASGLNNLVNTQQGVANSISNNLLNTGALQQGQQQQQENVDYQNFLEQRGWSEDQAAYLNNILKGNPASGSVNSQRSINPSNPQQTALKATDSLGGLLNGGSNALSNLFSSGSNIATSPIQNSSMPSVNTNLAFDPSQFQFG